MQSGDIQVYDTPEKTKWKSKLGWAIILLSSISVATYALYLT